jgi:hypothetical protein
VLVHDAPRAVHGARFSFRCFGVSFRPAAARCGPTGMMLVAPSEIQMPVPISDTRCISRAKSQTGWVMLW